MIQSPVQTSSPRATSFVTLSIIRPKAPADSVPPSKAVPPSIVPPIFFAIATNAFVLFSAEYSASFAAFMPLLIIPSRTISSGVFRNSDFFYPEISIFSFFSIICLFYQYVIIN